MSTPKKKPEPVKEPAPKKAVKKKVVKKVEEDEAASRAGMEQMSAVPRIRAAAAQRVAEPETILPAPEQHGEAVSPDEEKLAIVDDLKEKLAALEAYNAHEQPEPTKLTLSQRWHNFKNSTWFWVTISVFALIILWAVIAEIRRGKINKTIWKTQQTEAKITDEKKQLSKTEANLSEMLDIKQKVDSLNIIIDSMQKLASDHAAYEETMHQLNLKYKLRNYELQNQIRTASDDSLRKIVSDLSKQK